MTTPDITIGTPVFGGAPFMYETLSCIRRQTYPRFRVEISIDAGDVGSLDVIRPFLADERFRVTVQHERLGWKGNLNQLMRGARTEFFCYWQQDDFAADNYLERLRDAAIADPECAVAAAPMQAFGTLIHQGPPVTALGPPLERVLDFIEQAMSVPLRGLIRTRFLSDHQITEPRNDELNHVEFGFLARLAARGTFRPVPDTLYFKRFHRGSAHGLIAEDPEGPRRRAWINMGDEVLEAALSCAEASDHARVVAQVLDRLAVARPGRSFFQRDCLPGAVRRFTRDFFALTSWDAPDLSKFDPHDPRWSHRPLDPSVADAIREEHASARIRRAARHLGGIRRGPVGFPAAHARLGAHWLGYGWSDPEPIGTWTVGDRATLHVPTGAREITLNGRAFGTRGAKARLGWLSASGAPVWRDVRVGRETTTTVSLADIDHSGGGATLLLPDAARPCDLGVSADTRSLGFLLQELVFR